MGNNIYLHTSNELKKKEFKIHKFLDQKLKNILKKYFDTITINESCEILTID